MRKRADTSECIAYWLPGFSLPIDKWESFRPLTFQTEGHLKLSGVFYFQTGIEPTRQKRHHLSTAPRILKLKIKFTSVLDNCFLPRVLCLFGLNAIFTLISLYHGGQTHNSSCSSVLVSSLDLSIAHPKWRLDGPALTGHLVYSLVNHAYANLYHHYLVL